MRSFIIALLLLSITASWGCASRGQLNCDLVASEQYSRSTVATDKAPYSLRCVAAGSQYGDPTPAP